MPWGKWFTESDSGDRVKEKIEKSDSGVTEKHYLRTTGGNEKDHQHIVVKESSSGRSTAHGNTNVSKRS